MLDPRIYRTGLIAVVMALIVFAFSLQDEPGPLPAPQTPASFTGSDATATMKALAAQAPARSPGSAGDRRVADYVAARLAGYGFVVRRSEFTARTAGGARGLENVTGVLAGGSNNAIVIVAPRDAVGTPDAGGLSGTAVMLELARVLSLGTIGIQHHTLVLASTSGSVGLVGATQLASQLPGPVDAVLVLGDLASPQRRAPAIVTWANRTAQAPPALRNTLSAALRAQGQRPQAMAGLGGQLLHLAFPMAVTAQAPLNDTGYPAALLSLAGERSGVAVNLSDPHQAGLAQAQVSALGGALLQTVNALDAAGPLARPSAYLAYNGKDIPAWSLRLLVLALILPVLMAVVDGLARVRRRGRAVLPWVVWVLGAGVAFVLGDAVLLLARRVGLLAHAPGGPVVSGLGSPHTGGVIALAIAAVVILAGLLLVRPRLARLAGAGRLRTEEGADPGAGVAVALVLCAAVLLLWARNPFAALLLAPALHLWTWVGAGAPALRRPFKLALCLLGALPAAAAAGLYALELRLTPLETLWNGVLLVTGGQLGWVSVLLWCGVLGCLAGVLALSLVRAPRASHEAPHITVRGPISYAGPGSLGGTQSALRR